MGGKKPLRRPLWPPTRATASNYYPLGLDGAGGAAKPLLRAPKKPAPLHGRLPAFSGAVDAFERARKCFLEWRYFFSIILSEFLKNRVALHLRSSENTISGVRSKNPISRRQLVPHLQWNRPMNCCFILRPQFGQIRLLAPIKVYWSLAIISSADIPLASSFFNTDSASAFLDSSAAFFSAATFFASALESSFTATFKADFLLFNCSFSVLMLSDSAAISVSIANSYAQCNCRNMLFL